MVVLVQGDLGGILRRFNTAKIKTNLVDVDHLCAFATDLETLRLVG